jgi:hypothetical protein
MTPMALPAPSTRPPSADWFLLRIKRGSEAQGPKEPPTAAPMTVRPSATASPTR